MSASSWRAGRSYFNFLTARQPAVFTTRISLAANLPAYCDVSFQINVIFTGGVSYIHSIRVRANLPYFRELFFYNYQFLFVLL